MGAPKKIQPFRMNQLAKAASKIVDIMVNNTWCITYDEMEVVLKMIQCGIDEIRSINNINGEEKEEECS